MPLRIANIIASLALSRTISNTFPNSLHYPRALAAIPSKASKI